MRACSLAVCTVYSNPPLGLRKCLYSGIRIANVVLVLLLFNDSAELASVGVRFRLYCSERLRRERLLGQAFVTLSTLLMDGSIDASREQQLVVHLEPQYDSLFKVCRRHYI